MLSPSRYPTASSHCTGSRGIPRHRRPACPPGTPRHCLPVPVPLGAESLYVLPVPHGAESLHVLLVQYPAAQTPAVLNGYPLHEYCCMPRFFSGHLLSNWPELLFISKQSHLPHATLPPQFDCRMSAPWGTDSLPVHSGHLHGIDVPLPSLPYLFTTALPPPAVHE